MDSQCKMQVQKNQMKQLRLSSGKEPVTDVCFGACSNSQQSDQAVCSSCKLTS
jgi:hypothetical protein